MDVDTVVRILQRQANPRNVAGIARFGINPKNTLGVNIPVLRDMVEQIKKEIKAAEKQHALAEDLWKTGIHEARILAGMIDDPLLVTEEQMDSWIIDFDSWDVCDQVCMNLFDKTQFAFSKASEWARRDREFEKRAGFALVACLAWHDKISPDSSFTKFFPLIKEASVDERNFVKKAVNWALRQIGKRNEVLRKAAIACAK